MTRPEHRVYLLRHGETEWSGNGRHTGRTDIPLTANGERLARRAGRTLAWLGLVMPALVLTSPRERARRTAELAGLRGAATEPLLAEWDYGDFEGLTTPQIRESVPGWTVWTHSCPGGESADDVAARADKVLARVRHAESDVVLVGHGHFSRSLVARWLGLPVTSGVGFALDPAGVTVLGHERGAPQVVRSNIPAWQDSGD
ncbi:putative phosphoglycerate mutase [Saccharopolyspora erythraea NRRL 2338]|uniref:Phosphoglycerate mutase family protein n=2 Tax=Saccharopolyspora erythraea TaxID=1836 RepID=A4FNG7_SACEN|nr:acid phosphatase [Saccharopolyspora erythraea]EQD87140.1 acid phosphatase [Saccharopolyspora erythraea D]PFG99230.1 putative phosphoglycerate mutase [Saccharopolyspora erythraea NRRL 2338]QRK89175.1 acid phosphatase [Saccharopolyspora erythraea]CAM05592.1 phosphoglycerate mutase family protein [Saccharopolyspora erythraea NRRL 2338]